MQVFAEFSRHWLTWVAAASWQLALLVALVAAANRLLHRASPRLRHALWLLVLAKVFLPPALTTPVSIGRWGVEPLLAAVGLPHFGLDSGAATDRAAEDQHSDHANRSRPSSAAETAWAPRSPNLLSPGWLLGAWAVGVGLFWAMVGGRYLRLLVSLRKSAVIDEGPVRVALEKSALQLKLPRAPDLLAADLAAGPFLLGVLQPRIVLPQALLEQVDDAELRVVLAHELVHWQRHDTWIGWLQTLAQSIFWFHPFLWWANGRLRHERECVCDEAVLRQTDVAPEQYGQAIVRVLTSIRGRSLAEGGLIGVFERGSQLQNRLEEIMDYEACKRSFGWSSRLIVAALAIVFLPMAPGASPQPAAVAQAPARAARGAKRAEPTIVKTVPERGATDVDPQLSEIKVTFDRNMADGMSWTGGPPEFPPVDESRKARWIDARTCVLPVKLEKGAYYRLGINSTSYQNFRSRQGAPVAPATIYFVTKGASEELQSRVKPPMVVSMAPKSGAEDVDPAVTSLRVTFDRPMGDGMSWTGGGPQFPKIPEGQKASWSDDGLTCTLPVSLEPDHEYSLGLNSKSFINFQSKWGVPLEPVTYKFHTKQAE